MNQLAPQVKTIWAINTIARVFFLALLLFVYEMLPISKSLKITFLPLGVSSAIIFFAGILTSIIYPVLKYKYWKFDVRSDELYIERGILTRIKTIAPFRRLQHLDVEQSVLERMMGLGKLVVYTAGTRGADIIIPGLPIEYAEALREQLKNIDIEDAV